MLDHLLDRRNPRESSLFRPFIRMHKAFALAILLMICGVSTLDIRECNRALGMESGAITDAQITASSSFDQLSTGPQNARIRLNNGSGAWCPKEQISSTSNEWIQISFSQDMFITAVETQGRDDNGLGAEFAENYRIEYWRPSISTWARYSSGNGTSKIPGNSNTRTAELRVLEGGLVARRIRIVPLSHRIHTVCMRVELYGCTYKGSVVSYGAPDGDIADGLAVKDFPFDGTNTEGILCNGLGKLYDGSIGADNFEKAPERWVGWRSENYKDRQIVLNFTFAEQRNFSAISIHTNNHFKMHALAFSDAQILFSLDGVHFSSRIVTFKYYPDRRFDTSRWIRIPIPDRIGKVAQIRLSTAPNSSWLLISEFKFESNQISFELDEEVEHRNEIDVLHTNGVTYYAVEDNSSATNSNIFVVLLTLTVIFSFIGYFVWRSLNVRHSRIKSSSSSPTFHSKQPQLHLMIDGNTIKRVSPSTYQMATDNVHNALLEKNPGADDSSEYAEPDISLLTDSSKIPHFNCSSESSYGPSLIANPFMRATPILGVSSPLSSVSKFAEYGELDCTSLPEIDRNQLQFIGKLGEGDFGEITLCRLEKKFVAVKVLGSKSPDIEFAFQREIRMLGTLKHPNVVEVIAVCTRDRPILCVMEYMKNGDLKQYMQKLDDITTRLALSLATGLAAGLAYLESVGYIHRDIAARTCLVDHEGNAKIADFGMARSVYSSDYYTALGHELPIRWMSWEAALMNKFSFASDVWAFAVTVWEIMEACRQLPYAQLTDEQVLENLHDCVQHQKMTRVLQKPVLCPPVLYNQVMERCWTVEPSRRPSFQYVHLQLQTLMHSHL